MRYQIIIVSESELWAELILFTLIALVCLTILGVIYQKHRSIRDKKIRPLYSEMALGFALILLAQIVMIYWISSYQYMGVSQWYPPWVIVSVLNLIGLIAIGWSIVHFIGHSKGS
ncbi:MAG TPA: hypothetical protein EYP86_01850 [Candidatus Altiarchaeales archaeon]|nr:hypothetical protein [Candidatus Altiarchaeales archaeon]